MKAIASLLLNLTRHVHLMSDRSEDFIEHGPILVGLCSMTNYHLQPCTTDKWALFVFLHQDEGIFLLNSTCSVVIVS